MNYKRIILFLTIVLALTFASRGARRGIDLVGLPGDLENAIRWRNSSEGAIYELKGNLPIKTFAKEGDYPIVAVGNEMAIIVSRNKYVNGDHILEKYFRKDGRVKITSILSNTVDFLPKFQALSSQEVEQIEEAKQRWEAEKAQWKYEAGRMRAINRALSEIELLTDDRKVIDRAYENAATVYDKCYQKTKSTKAAEKAMREFADKLIEDIKRENERRVQNWAKEHPEEYAAMLKAQEEER